MKTNRQIKFIWDFYGGDAFETAEHHVRHLVTFFETNDIAFSNPKATVLDEMHSIATIVSAESNVQIIKNSLRPHRATIEEN